MAFRDKLNKIVSEAEVGADTMAPTGQGIPQEAILAAGDNSVVDNGDLNKHAVLDPSTSVTVKSGDTTLDTHRGWFMMNGQAVDGLNSHANVLRALVWVMTNNDPQVIKKAVDHLTDMVKNGAQFK